MDRLTFVAELVKSLAWPLTVVGVFLVLRRPLAGLIPLIGRLRFKDLELDFGRRLAEASAEAAALPPAAGDAARATAARGAALSDPALLRLVDASPRAAILEAWLRLEAAALAAARRRGTDEPVSHLRAPTRLIEALEELGVVDAREAAVFHELRSLRNSAAHALGFEPSPDAARDYVRLAARLEQAIAERDAR